jgi:hypothetical protein
LFLKPVIGPREESAILTAVGVAVTGVDHVVVAQDLVDLLWWHKTWLLILGLVPTAIFAASLVSELRKGPDWRCQG